MTNIFTSQAWVESQCGLRSRPLALQEIDPGFYVKESRLGALKRWTVYGNTDEQQNTTLNKLASLGSKAGVYDISCNFNMSRWHVEEIPNNYDVKTSFGTFLVACKPLEELLPKCSKGHKSDIKKSIKLNQYIEFTDDLEICSDLIISSYDRSLKKTPVNYTYLKNLRDALGEKVLFYRCCNSLGETQAVAVIIKDSDRAYYLHGGRKVDATTGSVHHLILGIAEDLGTNKVKYFDLGGVSRESENAKARGIYRFKKGFGGDYVPCVYWQLILKPILGQLVQVAEWGRRTFSSNFQ